MADVGGGMTPSIRAAGSDRLSNSSVTAAYCLVGVWALYLLLAPTTGFSWIESWHNEQRAAQIILLALTALLIAGLTAVGPDPIRTRLQLPGWWWAFIAIGVVSALVSKLPFAAFAEIALFVLLSTLVALTAALTMSQPERMAQTARYCAVLIAGAHVLAVLVRYVAALHIDKAVDLSVFMLGYANPRFASALYAVVMPFVAAMVINPLERRPLRVAAFASLCLLWTINLGLGTRGIWFAYLLATPALLLLIGGRQLARVVGALAVTALLGLLVFICADGQSLSWDRHKRRITRHYRTIADTDVPRSTVGVSVERNRAAPGSWPGTHALCHTEEPRWRAPAQLAASGRFRVGLDRSDDPAFRTREAGEATARRGPLGPGVRHRGRTRRCRCSGIRAC